MHNYLAVWTFTTSNGRRQEITMSFWANTDADARTVAHRWFENANPTWEPADFTITNLSQERAA